MNNHADACQWVSENVKKRHRRLPSTHFFHVKDLLMDIPKLLSHLASLYISILTDRMQGSLPACTSFKDHKGCSYSKDQKVFKNPSVETC